MTDSKHIPPRVIKANIPRRANTAPEHGRQSLISSNIRNVKLAHLAYLVVCELGAVVDHGNILSWAVACIALSHPALK